MEAPLSRQQIQEAVTETIRTEYSTIVSRLVVISDRDQRVKTFMELVENLPEDARNLLQMSSRKERQHIDHVRNTLAKIPEISKDRPQHDFSKDALYFFVTSSKFDFAVKNARMDELFTMETERHFRLERHHEQNERIHGVEFGSEDILEMAVDRMSRSIQCNQGRVNLEDMAKYVPRFPLGDNLAKQTDFNKYVLHYRALTEETYQMMS